MRTHTPPLEDIGQVMLSVCLKEYILRMAMQIVIIIIIKERSQERSICDQ